ncbi:MAG: hypothetical protein Q9227_007996 [Pyrenula ochraceoflavens]
MSSIGEEEEKPFLTSGEDIFQYVNGRAEKRTPARSALRYKVEELPWGHVAGPYTGEPRPEVDRAWSNLLKCEAPSSMLVNSLIDGFIATLVKISKEELVKMNRASIPLRDGTGYVGYLESNHMLHCVVSD